MKQQQPYTLHLGDCLEVLRTLPDASVDSIVTDPPYGLAFMGKRWDYDVPSTEVWAECLRVLKPGGHLLAFAGTRTQHRMAVRIEDAGFEIRDMIAWLYGSGFPKNHDFAGQRDDDGVRVTRPEFVGRPQAGGWGTSLKPALEPITVARKPLAGTVAENVLAHGTAVLNIDGCRVGDEVRVAAFTSLAPCHGNALGAAGTAEARRGTQGEPKTYVGRWPANVIHDGSDEVIAAFPQAPGQLAKASTGGTQRAGQNVYGVMKRGSNGAEPRGDVGSAARFFKQIEVTDAEWLENLSPALIADSTLSLSKLADAIAQSDAAISALPEGRQLNVLKAPSTSVTPSESRLIATSVITAIQSIASASLLAQQPERLSLSHSHVSVVAHQTPTGIMMITASLSSSAGCAESITFSITPKSLAVGEKVCGQSSARFMYCAKASKADRGEGNTHPTVKPTELMRYLCRLVTPPGGTVLDPFMGSGSTGKAAMLEGFRFVGIEREAEYIEIARARIAAALASAKPAPACPAGPVIADLFESMPIGAAA